MMDTLSTKIDGLRRRLPRLEELAESELALVQATGNSGPLEGSCKRRDDARDELRVLQQTQRGQAIQNAFNTLSALDTDLLEAQRERETAERRVAEAARHGTIVRWLNAPLLATRHGFGHSFGNVGASYNDNFSFRAWYLSGKARHSGLSESAAWFLDSEQCPNDLRFDLDTDRKRVCEYEDLRHAASLAALKCSDLHDRRRQLLLAHPELRTVA